ncbi:MAG: hypothetical protein JXR73_10675 [Candidatus Omnitrophica bacterium]|nr:hypothetical protein [Candidatus Omnitrophota bacterium]
MKFLAKRNRIGFIFLLLSLLVVLPGAWSREIQPFRTAQPVWPQDRQTEMNLFVGFRAPLLIVYDDVQPEGSPVVIRLAASSLYRLFLNGEFIGHGPARGPHGYDRVDEWSVTGRVRPGVNYVAIEAAGYNVNSFYLLDQPAFLQAEIQFGDRIAASTGGMGAQFEAFLLDHRIQKVQRYSFQRPFVEAYRLTPQSDAWRVGGEASLQSLQCAAAPPKKLLPRGVSYPRFDLHPPVRRVSEGEMQTGLQPQQLWKDRSLVNIGPQLGGYPEDQLELVLSNELQTVASKTSTRIDQPYSWGESVSITRNAYSIFDFGLNLTGFLGAKVVCSEKTRLYLTFDEILSDEDVDWRRLGCVNAVLYELDQGEYDLEAFEPYTFRYMKAIVLEGACELKNLYLRDYVNPDSDAAHFASGDPRLNRLFEAGRQTFIQNAVDVFMDCPSRERAGWLCDSFFTARTAFDLSRDCRVEANFFENYLLPDKFAHLPEGMLPMCYPSDHYDGVFIPNWAMWFVVELEEYYQRSGDRAMIDALEPKVMRLLEYFKPFLNQDGLLEKLESWVFIEWSAANQFVQDVNYPSNMLYAAVLDAAGRLYDRRDLAEQAARIRDVIRRQSFDGEFFADNAVRKDGRLEVTRNRSEVCQYFAFFFGVADPQSHPDLWKKLCDDFGPQRKETKAHPEVHFANSFIGNVLRMEILSRSGRCQQILDESIAYLLYMADRTGTLWENDGAYASCNHGFASHVVHVLYRDVLGVRQIDPVQKIIRLRFTDLDLEWCQGRIPLPGGELSLEWRRDDQSISYRVQFPAGYRLEVENQSRRMLNRLF